jgi:hypothetical protein
MAGELLTQVDDIERRLERLERIVSKLDTRQIDRIWSEIQTLWARIRR